MEQADIVKLRDLFGAAPFVRALGMAFASAQRGECVSTLAVRTDHLQQTGVVHAGVLTTMADHTAGGAAASTLPAGAFPLTTNLALSLLRPGRTAALRCVGRVIRSGRSVVFADAEVFAVDGDAPVLLAKAQVTFAVVTLPAA